MKKAILIILGILIIGIGLYHKFNIEEYDKKETHYTSLYLFAGGDKSEYKKKAEHYKSLEEFGEKGSTPCVIVGSALIVASFLIKNKKSA